MASDQASAPIPGPPATEPVSGLDHDAAEALLTVLPRWLVIALCVTTFFLALASLFFAVLAPHRIENSLARTFLCVAIGVSLGLSTFILYPQRLQLTRVPRIDLAIQIMGPAVLMIVFSLLLLAIVPSPTKKTWEFFAPHQGGKAVTFHFSTSALKPVDKDFEYHLVGDNSGQLVGIFVAFPEGATSYKGEFKPGGFSEAVSVTFERGKEYFDVKP